MATANAQKAALLLMGLDAATAGELLKAAAPETVAQIAAEMAYLRAAGAGAERSGPPAEVDNREPSRLEPLREFTRLLARRRQGGRGDFLQNLLDGAVGKQRAQEILVKVKELVADRDPFLEIRSVTVAELAAALGDESPQASAMVLSELPPKKSGSLLLLLKDDVRAEVVRRMVSGQDVPRETRLRVARVVRDRLRRVQPEQLSAAGGAAAGGPGAPPDRRARQLRNIAILLRGLPAELRDALVKAVGEQDQETARAVRDLMVIWEDMTIIPDRALQTVLRGLDARKLALALIGAGPRQSRKVRTNISERAAAMLDEEASLLSKPKKEDIQQAREAILAPLRELNGKGELDLEDAGDNG